MWRSRASVSSEKSKTSAPIPSGYPESPITDRFDENPRRPSDRWWSYDAIDFRGLRRGVVGRQTADQVGMGHQGRVIVTLHQIVLRPGEHGHAVVGAYLSEHAVGGSIGNGQDDFVDVPAALHPLEDTADQRRTGQVHHGLAGQPGGADAGLDDEDHPGGHDLEGGTYIERLFTPEPRALQLRVLPTLNFFRRASSDGEMVLIPSPMMARIRRTVSAKSFKTAVSTDAG